MDLEDRGRLVPVEDEVRVGEVVDDQHLVLFGERDDALEEVEVHHLGRRVVGKERIIIFGLGHSILIARWARSKSPSPLVREIDRTSAPAMITE